MTQENAVAAVGVPSDTQTASQVAILGKRKKKSKAPRKYTRPKPKTYIVQEQKTIVPDGLLFVDTEIGVRKGVGSAGEAGVRQPPADTEACLAAIKAHGQPGTYRIIAVCRTVKAEPIPVVVKTKIEDV